MIRRIHTATRPTLSLDASIDREGSFSLLQTMSDPEGDRTADVDRDEAVGRLMDTLRPREQEVLGLRFGLGGKPRLSLSQVGKVLAVSKERVRQIQDRAIEKLREASRRSDSIRLIETARPRAGTTPKELAPRAKRRRHAACACPLGCLLRKTGSGTRSVALHALAKAAARGHACYLWVGLRPWLLKRGGTGGR